MKIKVNTETYQKMRSDIIEKLQAIWPNQFGDQIKTGGNVRWVELVADAMLEEVIKESRS